MNRCFVLEQLRDGKSLKSAENFGRIEYIFCEQDRRPSIFSVEEYCEELVEQLQYRGFNPEKDYVVIVGNVVAMVVLIHALTAAYGRFNVLLYNAFEGIYFAREFGYETERHSNVQEG